MQTRPTPIFVLGLQRSGTTWLANVLANHPRIVAVQSEDHFGVHESIFFSHFARAYPDLDDESVFQAFAEAFTESDYYLLTGIEKEWLCKRRPRDHAEAFRALMDEMASRDGVAEAWVEKTPQHSLLAEELASAFPDARFVAILREPRAVIASHLGLLGDKPLSRRARMLELARLCLSCSLHERFLKRFCRDHPQALLTRYEALIAEPAAETERICSFIGAEFTPAMLELPWSRNTSFRADRPDPSSVDRLFVGTMLAALRAVPLRALRSWVARRQARQPVEWPSWCWRRRDSEVAA